MIHFAGKAAKALTLSVFLSLLLCAAASAAEVGTGVGAVTASSLRMRSSASTSSSTVTCLDKGSALSILETVDGWYRVGFAGQTGYVSADYVIMDRDGVFTAYGLVNSSDVTVRSAPSTDGDAVATLDKGTSLTVTGFQDGWYSVKCTYGTTGYIRSDLIDLTDSASGSSQSSSGSQAVALAQSYLGVRYVYGGSTPKGFDCSGFTSYIMGKYGYSLPHTASGQWLGSTGSKVYSASALSVGDLVFFCDPSRSNGKVCSHAGIYIGDGQFIHASSAKYGVVISSLNEPYYAKYFVGGKHML